MNRSEKARAVVLFEELAVALRAELFGEAAHEHSQGSTPSWRMGEVTVSSSLSNPTVVIDDQAAFLAYVQATYPTEVETVVTTTTQVRPHFAKDVLTRLAKSGDVVDHEGTVVPGLRFVPGGNLRSISVKPTPGFKADATRFALEVAAGQRPLALPSLTEEMPPIEMSAESALLLTDLFSPEYPAAEAAYIASLDAGAQA
jgi:hypothetical protein